MLAIADLLWQRRKIDKSLRMTKEEVKQEGRQADIAPEVRGALRRKQFQLARRRMLAEVPTADVVVVNPTHYAAALRYDGTKPAPELVAKGVDHVAAAIRAAAEEHGVPIVTDPPLARTLYRQVDLGAQIPEELFAGVAQVLAYVYRIAGRRRHAARRRRRVALQRLTQASSGRGRRPITRSLCDAVVPLGWPPRLPLGVARPWTRSSGGSSVTATWPGSSRSSSSS